MNDEERLLEALRKKAGKRERLRIDVVWAAFREAIRGYTGATEARPRLAELLEGLARQQSVVLPKGKKLWDRTADPALPAWVRVPRAGPPKAERLDHRAIPWPPEMAFVASLPQVGVLDDLLAIKRFLAEGGRERCMVPARERSLEVFGDEKRLDGLTSSVLFRDGRLSLELLRCYEVAPPLVWTASPVAAAGAPVLVLENLHTYESFRRWNLEAGMYSAVAYGHGSEFKATCRDLPRLCGEVGTTVVRYFGDLDVQGLVIPVHAVRVLADARAEVRLEPATRWYAALLERSARAVVSGKEQVITDDLISWLPPELRAETRAVLEEGKRLPQELVGTDVLADGTSPWWTSAGAR